MMNKKIITTMMVAVMMAAGVQRAGAEEASQHDGSTIHLSTNLLYDAALVPNIGVEYAFDRLWSAKAEALCAWWSNDARHKYWRVMGGSIEVRRWLGDGADALGMKGHHIGAYAGGYRYDFEPKDKGEMADFNYALALTYGYSWDIGKRLRLDATVGVGYIGGDFKKYKHEDGKYVWLADMKRNYLGLTRAELSLVWIIGKKGGEK